jgi:membrane protease subunit (stomatin/prohibitin family)
MGFIKAIKTATAGQLSDAFREVIKYNNNDKLVLIKKITTENGIIQNESRLFVEPGQCAIYTDNGAIKDIITEPGMYFMDTSSPSLFQVNIFQGIGETFLETMKRVAYEGQVITTQAVYFVSLAEITNIKFNDNSKILYKDPQWGSMEIELDGTYGLKVTNPVNLLTNINSNSDICHYTFIGGQVNEYVNASLMTELNKLDVSFDKELFLF